MSGWSSVRPSVRPCMSWRRYGCCVNTLRFWLNPEKITDTLHRHFRTFTSWGRRNSWISSVIDCKHGVYTFKSYRLLFTSPAISRWWSITHIFSRQERLVICSNTEVLFILVFTNLVAVYWKWRTERGVFPDLFNIAADKYGRDAALASSVEFHGQDWGYVLHCWWRWGLQQTLTVSRGWLSADAVSRGWLSADAVTRRCQQTLSPDAVSDAVRRRWLSRCCQHTLSPDAVSRSCQQTLTVSAQNRPF